MSDDAKLVKLTRKQQKFIDEYLLDFNATQAAIRAGYRESSATHTTAWENLRKPAVKAEIDRRLDEVRMGKAEVLRRISDIAAGDMGEFLDTEAMGFDMNLKKAKERGLTKLIKRVKQKTTIFIAKKESDEDREVHELEIELYPADHALETLGKHHKLFSDTLTVQNPDGSAITWAQFVRQGKDDTDPGADSK